MLRGLHIMHMRLCRRARAIGMTLAIIRTIADDGADDSLRRYREPPHAVRGGVLCVALAEAARTGFSVCSLRSRRDRARPARKRPL